MNNARLASIVRFFGPGKVKAMQPVMSEDENKFGKIAQETRAGFETSEMVDRKIPGVGKENTFGVLYPSSLPPDQTYTRLRMFHRLRLEGRIIFENVFLLLIHQKLTNCHWQLALALGLNKKKSLQELLNIVPANPVKSLQAARSFLNKSNKFKRIPIEFLVDYTNENEENEG